MKSLGTSRGHRPRILRQAIKQHGYRTVCLYRGDSRQRRISVHRLVLTAFIGDCPSGYVACHHNGDASDNRLANLYWGTVSQNQHDSVRHGTHRHTRKTHCPSGHPYDASNTRVYRGRWRYCRTCQADRHRQERAS
ncbi:HNH endonuclease signature motif containing protein [Mycolicibacterium vanbaalenii]|uniref:HNH endonuclease signature motif containing protein n=1 Tax=Mycolicibacterium vanbaalenii TaxID=110539 RepID=UPI0035C6A23E